MFCIPVGIYGLIRTIVGWKLNTGDCFEFFIQFDPNHCGMETTSVSVGFDYCVVFDPNHCGMETLNLPETVAVTLFDPNHCGMETCGCGARSCTCAGLIRTIVGWKLRLLTILRSHNICLIRTIVGWKLTNSSSLSTL